MAIVHAESVQGSGGSPAPATTFAGAVSVGDILVASILLIGNPTSVTVADNVNAGNYTQVGSFFDSTNGWWFSIHAKQATSSASAGTCIVTGTEGSNQFGNIDLDRFTGFVGTMTVEPGFSTNFSGATSAVSANPLTSGHANEIFFCVMHTTVGINSGPSGNWIANNVGRSYYAIETTNATTDNFVLTLNSSAAWSLLVGAIYDAPANTASIAWTV